MYRQFKYHIKHYKAASTSVQIIDSMFYLKKTTLFLID